MTAVTFKLIRGQAYQRPSQSEIGLIAAPDLGFPDPDVPLILHPAQELRV
jgi:hypothetical protein